MGLVYSVSTIAEEFLDKETFKEAMGVSCLYISGKYLIIKLFLNRGRGGSTAVTSS